MKNNFKQFSVAMLVALVSLFAEIASAQDVSDAPNNSWISVSGTIVSSSPDAFRLDYGPGVITVEMDDFDFYAEGRALMENDQVVVYGRIDDDLFESRTIEASSVFVENLGTHFYANPADEEDFATWTTSYPVVVGRSEVTGTVTAVNDRTFTISTGTRRVDVDTSTLGYDPMDERGFVRVEVGDRVKVGGPMADTLFTRQQMVADWLVELR